MNIPLSNKALALSLAALVSAPAFSEDTRTLTLRERANPTQTLEITLQDVVRIRAEDGGLEAYVQTLPGNCPDPGGPGSGLTCGDVEVGPMSFSVSPGTTVTEGQDLTFSWFSRGAFKCEALDGENDLPGWKNRTLAPDSRDAGTTAATTRVIPTTGLGREAPYEARLRCSNGPVLGAGDGQTNIRTLSITVNPPDGGGEGDPALPAFCSSPSRQMPSDWTRMATGNLSCVMSSGGSWLAAKDCRQWGGIWSEPFWTGGATHRIATGRGNARQFIAAEFSTEGLPAVAAGRYSGVEGTHAEPASAIVSISQCPGDFDREALGDCMGVVNQQWQFGWRTSASTAGGRRCVVEPGRRYFFNIVFTDQGNPGPGGLTGITSQTVQPAAVCSPGPCGLIIDP